VDDSVEDRIGDRGVCDPVMPVLDGELSGEEGGSFLVSVVEDFKKISSGRGIQGRQSPIVENQHVDTRKRAEASSVGSVGSCNLQFAEQPRQAIEA
jgi:hypothetical protein